MTEKNIIIFGASGAIGGVVAEWFASRGKSVICVSRASVTSSSSLCKWVSWDPETTKEAPTALLSISAEAIVWAQGANCNDSISNYDPSVHKRIYSANVLFILDTLHALLNANLLAAGCRMVVVSSIWQEIARQNKLSYTISKAALKGLVHSLSIDLGQYGYLVNAVLPGALDTPMTRKNLTAKQIKNIERATPTERLPALDDVCRTIEFLCSSANSSVTGQFIKIDGGFSYARIV